MYEEPLEYFVDDEYLLTVNGYDIVKTYDVWPDRREKWYDCLLDGETQAGFRTLEEAKAFCEKGNQIWRED